MGFGGFLFKWKMEMLPLEGRGEIQEPDRERERREGGMAIASVEGYFFSDK